MNKKNYIFSVYTNCIFLTEDPGQRQIVDLHYHLNNVDTMKDIWGAKWVGENFVLPKEGTELYQSRPLHVMLSLLVPEDNIDTIKIDIGMGKYSEIERVEPTIVYTNYLYPIKKSYHYPENTSLRSWGPTELFSDTIIPTQAGDYFNVGFTRVDGSVYHGTMAMECIIKTVPPTYPDVG